MGRTLLSRQAEVVRGALGLVYLGGTLVHLILWTTNRTAYAEMTPYILFEWYRELWTGLVIPNLGVLLPLLAAFELLVAVAILSKHRMAKFGLLAGAAFNLAVAPLGFWWPSNIALVVIHLGLLRVAYPETTIDRVGRRLVPPKGTR